jgi:hypothetical protein
LARSACDIGKSSPEICSNGHLWRLTVRRIDAVTFVRVLGRTFAFAFHRFVHDKAWEAFVVAVLSRR